MLAGAILVWEKNIIGWMQWTEREQLVFLSSSQRSSLLQTNNLVLEMHKNPNSVWSTDYKWFFRMHKFLSERKTIDQQ